MKKRFFTAEYTVDRMDKVDGKLLDNRKWLSLGAPFYCEPSKANAMAFKRAYLTCHDPRNSPPTDVKVFKGK